MLATLELFNVRCHRHLLFQPLAQHNILLGENAQGKTTILEALYFLARCRSFRARQARELITQGAEAFRIEARFEAETYQRLACARSPRERKLEVDSITQATLDEYWGKCAAVIFKNRDMDLLQGSADRRRQWMDGFIAQGRKDYLHNLQRYQSVLEQTNALLKQDKADFKLWQTFLEQRNQLAVKITDTRQEYTAQLRQRMTEMVSQLLQHNFEIDYQQDTERLEQTQELWQRERRMGFVLHGPHRDDWLFKLAGQPLRTFGSEGQQRTTALALKLAEARLLTELRGKPPILLFDDVFKELDPVRMSLISRWLPAEAQTFMATTRMETLPQLPNRKLWKIHHNSAHWMEHEPAMRST